MYSLWRRIKRVMAKILLKILTWAFLIVLVLFTTLLNIFLRVFRLAAFPCGIIAAVAACFYYCEAGLCQEFYWLAIGILTGTAAYFVLPKSLPLLDSLKERVTYHAYERIFIRSPVKYTM